MSGHHSMPTGSSGSRSSAGQRSECQHRSRQGTCRVPNSAWGGLRREPWNGCHYADSCLHSIVFSLIAVIFKFLYKGALLKRFIVEL